LRELSLPLDCNMASRKHYSRLCYSSLIAIAIVLPSAVISGRTPKTTPSSRTSSAPEKKLERRDDSLITAPVKELSLQPAGARKAEGLAQFVEGERLEEMGEIDRALEAYQKVLNVDPGEVDLALHVADMLSRQGDYPLAIDVLKDAIKAKPREPSPYLQLSLIYARDLKKLNQGLNYAIQALALDPKNIDAYQRIFEIQVAIGQPQKAIETLNEAERVQSKDPAFWIQLGKLYASVIFKSDAKPTPEEVQRVNGLFKKAAGLAGNDPNVFKDVADYFAASEQISEALPFYVKVLELEPDDINAREKLASGFVLTNKWPEAIATLQELIKSNPEKSEAYELLAGVFEDEGRAFEREKQPEKAKSDFAKAAQNYQQSLLINPSRATNYLHLAELLLGRLKDSAHAVEILQDARRHFPNAPEMTYYLAIALRESKQPQAAVTTFEEALHEAELSASEIVTARFYFDYGATAEQAGLYDKAADLFKKSIAMDPANAAEAYNYLGFMWADHNLHLDEAEEMIRRALEMDPNNGAYLDSLGWLYFRKAKFDQALQELLLAAQNLPTPDAVVFEHIGDAYSKLNQMMQALDYWQKAVLLDPTNKKLAQKIENAKTKVSKGSPSKVSSLQ